ncbi:MAG: type II toxin-antitoxin system RelE/ParE family toxin [Candidatus Omnitrophota bacterium]
MYSVVYTKEAKTAIDKLSLKKKRQIKVAVERISQDPQVGKALTHELKGLFSYRSGDYRIIYNIRHSEILVIILTVGHRKDVYSKTVRKIN